MSFDSILRDAFDRYHQLRAEDERVIADAVERVHAQRALHTPTILPALPYQREPTEAMNDEH